LSRTKEVPGLLLLPRAEKITHSHCTPITMTVSMTANTESVNIVTP